MEQLAQTHLRWPASTREALRAVAQQNHRSLSGELRAAIDEHLVREAAIGEFTRTDTEETHA